MEPLASQHVEPLLVWWTLRDGLWKGEFPIGIFWWHNRRQPALPVYPSSSRLPGLRRLRRRMRHSFRLHPDVPRTKLARVAHSVLDPRLALWNRFMFLSFFAMKANNKGNIGHDAHLGGAIVGFLIAAALHPQIVTYNPWVFLSILVTSVLMLIYLWVNPMFLPAFAISPSESQPGIAAPPAKTSRREFGNRFDPR